MSFHFGWRTEHDVVKGDKLTDGSRVKSVHAYIVDGKGQEEKAGGGGDCHSQVDAHWIVDSPIANPMSIYAEHKTNRKNWGIDVLGTVICVVELENGIKGVGVSVGGPPACYIIEEHLSRFVEGQDPRNVELIWDQMWRSTVNYGRKGLPLQAISAVDLAIWDCLGKVRKEPVYNLLGGKTKQRLPVYGTTQRPELAKKLGLCGAKIPLPYGPVDGDAGMRANIERIKACREAVGPDFPLMIDCYMSLTVPYTIELARRIDREVPGGVKWIEEHLPPDDYDGYAEVKKRVDTNLWTCGEHEYTRYGFKMLLERKCCDLLQPDMCWVGGLTEARRIVALAAAYDIPVIPHGSSVFSYHMQIAFTNCPIAESIILSPDAASIQPIFGKLFLDEPLPVDGFVTLDPSKHGFGITLNPDIKLVRPYEHTFRSAAQSAPDFVDQKEWLAKASKINTDPNDTKLWKS